MAQGVRKSGDVSFHAEKMNVLFRKAALSVTGDLGEVIVEVGSDRIEITYAQALSLAKEIMLRCQ